MWRRHPVTELVFDHYLQAFIQSLHANVMETWLAGKLSLQVEHDARGYIHAMRHLQGMGVADVRAFFNKAGPDEEATRPARRSGTGYS